MPLLSVKTFRPHPGKEEETLQLVRDARSEMLRVDPNRTVRIFQVPQGEHAGEVSIMIEYADRDAFKRIRAKEQADPGWQAIGERANGPDRPAETLSYDQMVEVE
ncbi:MAG: NIPSNAP family protein [Thermomicrobiales bacterium]